MLASWKETCSGWTGIPYLMTGFFLADLRFHVLNTSSGQFITTSAEVTPNGGLVRESPQKWP